MPLFQVEVWFLAGISWIYNEEELCMLCAFLLFPKICQDRNLNSGTEEDPRYQTLPGKEYFNRVSALFSNFIEVDRNPDPT
jgi:hypothetical protein